MDYMILGELMLEQSKLDEELSHLIERHQEEQERLESEHQHEISGLRDEWKCEMENQIHTRMYKTEPSLHV